MFLVLLFLISCKKEVTVSGKVVSAVDGEPLNYVTIHWTNYNRQYTYTDSLGNFTMGNLCRCAPDCPPVQLLFRREEYQEKYVDLTEQAANGENVVIELIPNDKGPIDFKENRLENLLKSLNSFISLLNLFTLTMICLAKLRHKALWILSVLFLSVTVKYNYLTEELHYYPFSFFIQIRLTYLGWYVYYIPVAAIAFWTYYFFRRKSGTDLLSK